MISTSRALACGFFLFAALPARTETLTHEPVAIVYGMTGEAQRVEPGRSRKAVHLFDSLPAGTILDLGPNSRLFLAFGTGKRYEISGPARATLGKGDLGARSGGVRPLPSVPRLPRLNPIAEDDQPGLGAGAVRIRSEAISGLHPDRGATNLATAIRLGFDPVPAAPKYHVQIIDREGKVLFSTDTQTAEVSVPPALLAPGRTYLWTVETRERRGAAARGEATLVTLDAGQTRGREELRSWVQHSGSADDAGLLEGVDRALGLWEEPHHATEDAQCPLTSPGLAVESVKPESAAFRAGLIQGDRLFSWCRTSEGQRDCATHGDLRTPFDWLEIEIEDVPRGESSSTELEDRKAAVGPCCRHPKALPLHLS